MSDTLLLHEGMKTLIDRLGIVEAERFIYLMNKEHSDYTKFRHTLFEGMSFEDICRESNIAKIKADERMKKAKDNE